MVAMDKKGTVGGDCSNSLFLVIRSHRGIARSWFIRAFTAAAAAAAAAAAVTSNADATGATDANTTTGDTAAAATKAAADVPRDTLPAQLRKIFKLISALTDRLLKNLLIHLICCVNYIEQRDTTKHISLFFCAIYVVAVITDSYTNIGVLICGCLIGALVTNLFFAPTARPPKAKVSLDVVSLPDAYAFCIFCSLLISQPSFITNTTCFFFINF